MRSTSLAIHAALGLGLAWLAHVVGFGALPDESIDHSHIGLFGPWVGVAVVVALVRGSSMPDRIEWRRVVALQVAALLFVEGVERIVQALPLVSVLSAPVVLALLTGAALGVLLGGINDLWLSAPLAVALVDRGRPPPPPAPTHHPRFAAAASSRAPPTLAR